VKNPPSQIHPLSYHGELQQAFVGWGKYFLLASRFTFGSQTRVFKAGQSDECICESERYFSGAFLLVSSLHPLKGHPKAQVYLALRNVYTYLAAMTNISNSTLVKFKGKRE
jgi:hypothetical protein